MAISALYFSDLPAPYTGDPMPYPSVLNTPIEIQGGTLEMADGTVVVDIVAPGLVGNTRKVYNFEWVLLTSAEADMVEAAFNTLVENDYVEMTGMESEAYLVTLTKDAKLKRQPVKIQDEFRYNMAFSVKVYGNA